MLYLISGASRSGKTMIAKEIQRDKGISYLSLDWIVMGFTNGMPESGIHDKLFPDEIAIRIRFFVEAMFESMIWVREHQVIEGEAILPECARVLVDRHPGFVKAIFLGFTDVDVARKVAEVKEHSEGERDWLTKESDEYIKDHIENMVAYSQKVRKQCALHDMPYFDTSSDFLGTLETATNFLFQE